MMNTSDLHAIRLPTSYLEDTSVLQYGERWKEYAKQMEISTSSTIVFGLCFFGSRFLVGCSNRGQIIIWKIPLSSKDGATLIDFDPNPVLVFSLRDCNKTCLYSIQFIEPVGSNSILAVSGDGGIYFVNWTDQIAPFLEESAMKPETLVIDVLKQFRPHASSLEKSGIVEVNDFVVDQDAVYGAAGDAFGCYKWNLERGDLVATYNPKRTSYLHTVCKSGAHSILFGGEDGTLELWDSKADKHVHSWALGGWVGASAVSNDWWHVGGGASDQAQGFAASIHGPTRSLVTNKNTPERIQYMLHDSSTLYSVGSDSFLSRWRDPCTLRQRQKAWCHTPSAFAIAVSGDNIAVAGEGPTVDIFDKSVPLCQFICP